MFLFLINPAIIPFQKKTSFYHVHTCVYRCFVQKGSSIELQSSITRENLRILMTMFYEKAIEDEVLAPFFIDEIGDDLSSEDWFEHIDLLADFWLAKMLGEDTYYGNFVGAHVKMPHLKRETFTRWLELFSKTADEVYIADIAEGFKKKGDQFAKQFLNTKKKI